MPVQSLGDRATDQRAAGDGETADATVDPHDCAAPLWRERRREDGQADGHHHRRTKTLNGARGNQQPGCRRQRAGRRRQREQPKADGEDPAPPETIAKRGRRDDPGRKGQRERIDGPFE